MVAPIRSQGMVIVGSSHEPDPSKLPQPTREYLVTWRGLIPRTYECGHKDKRSFKVSACGVRSRKITQKQHCPACFLEDIKKHMIFCALCGLPIMPGDGVVAYDADNEGVREDAHRIGDSVLGCLRTECCPSAGFFCGHWTMDGFKPYDTKRASVL